MCPIYAYECTHCKYEEDHLEPLSAPSIQDCPKCSYKATFIRKITAPTFILAGGGWYADSYQKKH